MSPTQWLKVKILWLSDHMLVCRASRLQGWRWADRSLPSQQQCISHLWWKWDGKPLIVGKSPGCREWRESFHEGPSKAAPPNTQLAWGMYQFSMRGPGSAAGTIPHRAWTPGTPETCRTATRGRDLTSSGSQGGLSYQSWDKYFIEHFRTHMHADTRARPWSPLRTWEGMTWRRGLSPWKNQLASSWEPKKMKQDLSNSPNPQLCWASCSTIIFTVPC